MLNKPKKSLGQNFLHDQNILKTIVKHGNIKNNDQVLEIGPGTGNLTAHIISQKPKKIFLIEKDKVLSSELKKKFKSKVEIITNDILKISSDFYKDKNFIIFGNLPYNISTKILTQLCLNEFLLVTKLILMFQKEVADRIIAKVNTNKYGRLTILANWKFNVKKICDVSPNSFFPKPKVQSSVLEFLPKKKKFFIKDPKNIGKVTNVFFSQRRKMIKKPINSLFKKNFNYSKLQINPFDRPQNISIEKYFEITKEFESSLS